MQRVKAVKELPAYPDFPVVFPQQFKPKYTRQGKYLNKSQRYRLRQREYVKNYKTGEKLIPVVPLCIKKTEYNGESDSVNPIIHWHNGGYYGECNYSKIIFF